MIRDLQLTHTRVIQIDDQHNSYLLTDSKYGIHLTVSYEEALMEYILHLKANKEHLTENDSFYVNHNLRINNE